MVIMIWRLSESTNSPLYIRPRQSTVLCVLMIVSDSVLMAKRPDYGDRQIETKQSRLDNLIYDSLHDDTCVNKSLFPHNQTWQAASGMNKST